MKGPYIIAITGASGAIYGIRLLEYMLKQGFDIYLTISEEAKYIIKDEIGLTLGEDVHASLCDFFKIKGQNLLYYPEDDLTAPIASGSNPVKGMVIVPSSMKVVSAVACGFASNLIERAADVILKERRLLIIVPRETPLNRIHLRNLLTLSEMGVHVIPAMPAFYHKPSTVDDMVNFIVGRILDGLHIENNLYRRWREK